MTDPECLFPDTPCALRRPVRLGRGEDDADSMDVCVWQQGDETKPCDMATTQPVCVRCDYGPNHDSDGCRGWKDADEPCRNAEPDEYREADDDE